MSASLVGSEMCIRDSFSSFQQLSAAFSSFKKACDRARARCGPRWPYVRFCLLYTSDAADDMA
eukprot:1459997-Alexandrium_andersonii.AAC.1